MRFCAQLAGCAAKCGQARVEVMSKIWSMCPADACLRAVHAMCADITGDWKCPLHQAPDADRGVSRYVLRDAAGKRFLDFTGTEIKTANIAKWSEYRTVGRDHASSAAVHAPD